MAISTWQNVIAELRKSQLLAPDELDEAIVATRDLSDPSVIARKLVTESLLTRWQAAELISGRIPLKIGKYRLRDQTGFTDLGPVYAAENIETGNRVELKTIGQKVDSESPEFKCFVNESRVIASINHPNVLRICEIIFDSGTAYLVTEDHGGRALQRLVEKQHLLSPELAADYICQAAEGMAEVHSHDLVHRELRPDNLFVDEEGTIKIGGLGVACLAQNSPKKSTAADAVKYLSPEQASGDEAGPASDVYALGCIFYFLLTGRPPFSDGNTKQQLQQRLENAPPPVTELRSDVPEEIAAVCATMLATSLESRYGDAHDVVAALSPWQTTTPEADDAPTSVVPLHLDNADNSVGSLPTATLAHARATPKRANRTNEREAEPAAVDILGSTVAAKSKSSRYAATSKRKQPQIIVTAVVLVGLLVAGGVTVYTWLPDDDTRHARRSPKARKSKVASQEPLSRQDEPARAEREKAIAGTAAAEKASREPKSAAGNSDGKPPDAPGQSNTPPATTDGGEATAGGDAKTDLPEDVQEKPAASEREEAAAEKARQDKLARVEREKAAAEKAAAEKAPPPTSSKPFTLEQLAETISLPPPESKNTEPVVIGTLPGALPEDFTIRLHSNPAEPGRLNRQFFCEKEETKEEASPATAPQQSLQGRSWQVSVGTGEAAKENAKPIARLVLSEEQLGIQWTENAADRADASYLQNCLLGVRGGGQERFVPLRQPSDFPELKLKFSGPNSYTVPVAAMPDSQYVRVEILGLRGLTDETTPQRFREARSLLDKPHDETTIELGAGDSRLLIGIKSRVGTTKNKPYLKIDLTAAVAWDVERPVVPFAEFAKESKRRDDEFKNTEGLLKLRQQQRKAAQVGQKAVYNKPIAALQGRIAIMKPTIDKWRASREVIKGVGGNSRLHFRVYYEVGGRQVDLIRTVAGKEPAEPGPKRRPGKK